jgi:hypothetical protein
MKALSQPALPLSQVLLNRATEMVSRALASMKPQHRADQIAAVVAASNNPSGA